MSYIDIETIYIILYLYTKEVEGHGCRINRNDGGGREIVQAINL